MHILVEIDGVLRDHAEQPIPTGIIMVSTLIVHNQITFISSMDRAKTEQWLDIHKIVNYDNLVDSSVALAGEDLTKRQIDYARSLGGLSLFITGNPHLWAYAFDQGIASVMFGMPSYIRPEFRPDAPKKVRAWDEIEKAVEQQNTALAQDRRLLRTESINFE